MDFYKYHGNGNDFIIIDNRKNDIKLDSNQIQRLCHRRFGIGADGLMLLQESNSADFEMIYYNSDGRESSMCGNGGRCIAAFAFKLGLTDATMEFMAFDGIHKAKVICLNDKHWHVSLQLSDVERVEKNEGYYFLDTGSPHYVEFVDKVAEIDVNVEGKKTRYSETFSPNGTNVNFVEIGNDRIFVRTYERGVEMETLSCGTGVTASAIAAFLETKRKDFAIHTTGGDFKVSFDHDEENNVGIFSNIWLDGPAKLVYEGKYHI